MVIAVSLLILFASPWFYHLNIYLKLITVFTVAAIFLLEIKNKITLKKPAIILFIISLLLIIASITPLPDVKTRVDIEREWASTSKLNNLAPIFSNKYIETYRTTENLFFQNLDFGNYFFAGHPRERVPIDTQKLFAATLILIVIGLIKIKKDLRFFLMSFFIFAVSLSLFLKDRGPTGHFLILPIMAFLSGRGFTSLYKDYGTKGKIILTVTILLLIFEAISYYASF